MTESIEIIQETPALTENEIEESGSDPNVSALNEYFKASSSICMIVILVLMFICAQFFAAFADFWVAFWLVSYNILTNLEKTPDFLKLIQHF